MPLYEFLVLAKPNLARSHLTRMIQKVGDLVMGSGGIITDVVSYGEQSLAYDIRKPNEKYEKVRMPSDQRSEPPCEAPSCACRPTSSSSTSSPSRMRWRRSIRS